MEVGQAGFEKSWGCSGVCVHPQEASGTGGRKLFLREYLKVGWLENRHMGPLHWAVQPGLGQGHTRGLTQAPGQLAGLLHQQVSGDDRQVQSQ